MSFLVKTLLLLMATASPACSIVIRCLYFDRITIDGTFYMCQAVSIQNHQVNEVTAIQGNHLAGRSNDDVGSFILASKNVSTIPQNLERFFPNIVVIQLVFNTLTSISSRAWASWPNLRLIYAEQNRIESLDGDIFQHNPKLERIYFQNNSIKSVGVNLLSNLSQLVYVDFRFNPCINAYASSPQAIEALKAELLTQCPPLVIPTLPTSTADSCTARCSINEESDDLRERIEELEKTVREMKSNPCSCSP